MRPAPSTGRVCSGSRRGMPTTGTPWRAGRTTAPLRAAVDAACVEAGRDPTTLVRTALVQIELPGGVPYPSGYAGWVVGPGCPALAGSPETMAAEIRAYADAGINHLQVWVNPTTVAGVEALAPVLELLDHD